MRHPEFRAGSSRRALLGALTLVALLGHPASGAQERTGQSSPVPRPFIVEQLTNEYRFENDGTGTHLARARFRILTEEGRQALGQAFFPYQEKTRSVRISYVKTIKPSGDVIDAPPESVMDATPPVAQVAPVFSDLKYKVVPVPGLQVGDRLEYEVVTTTHTPLKEGDFWAFHVPIRNTIVDSERVVLNLPVEREVVLQADEDVEPSVEERDGRRILTWTLANPEPLEGDVLRKRLFAVSTLTTWDELGSWMRDLIAARAILTPELQRLAEELVEGRETSREKAQALYDYVTHSIRYVSVSLGIGGFQPHAAAETRRNEFGDCKDKHTLLAVLMQAVGLEAHPALLNTSGEVDTRVPMPDFDHMITVWSLGDDRVWLDTTLELAPFGFLPPRWLGSESVLLILPDKIEFTRIPESTPVPHLQQMNLSASLDGAGRLTAEVVYRFRGTQEVMWRNLARQGTDGMIAPLLEMGFGQPGRVEGDAPTTSDPMDFSGPFTIEHEWTKEGFVNPLAEIDRVDLPSPLIGAFSRIWGWKLRGPEADDDTDEDQSPLSLGGPASFDETLEIETGEKFDITPPSGVSLSKEFARYESSYDVEDGKLLVRRNLEILVREIPATDREALRSFVKDVRRDLQEDLAFGRRGDVEPLDVMPHMDPYDLNDAGLEALDSGELDLARDLFEAAVEKDPEHVYAWNNLGRVHLKTGALDEAREMFEKQIAITPADKWAHGNLARALYRQGHLREAMEASKRHAEINPEDTAAQAMLADFYGWLEMWAESEVGFRKALILAPDWGPYLVGLGIAQLHLGKKQKAMKNLERALETTGKPQTYNDIAYALAETGEELELAAEYAESAVLRVGVELKLLRSLQGWRRKLPLQDSLSSFLDTLGWVRFKQGDLDEAETHLLAAFELQPHREAALHIAAVNAERGRFDAALDLYVRAAHLSGDRELEVPEYLLPHARERFGEDLEGLGDWLARESKGLPEWRAVESSAGKFRWPAEAVAQEAHHVLVVALVDERGRVLETEIVNGSSPWKEAAEKDAQSLRFNPVSWDGSPIKTIRLVDFAYRADGTILVQRSTMKFL